MDIITRNAMANNAKHFKGSLTKEMMLDVSVVIYSFLHGLVYPPPNNDICS